MREISVGDRLASGDDSRLEILHPPPDGMGNTENADSILLSIVWHGRRFADGRSRSARHGSSLCRPDDAVRCCDGSASRQRSAAPVDVRRLVPPTLGRDQRRHFARLARRDRCLQSRGRDRAEHIHLRRRPFRCLPPATRSASTATAAATGGESGHLRAASDALVASGATGFASVLRCRPCKARIPTSTGRASGTRQ